MTLTLGTIITAARDRSPWFHRTRVTDAIIARFLSDAQNELIGAAVRRDPQYLAQTANIVIHLDGSDAPGTVGAGTSGGVPGSTDDDGIFSTSAGVVGSLVEANTTSAAGAAIFMSDRVVSSATATTITSAGANRTTNQDANRLIEIVAGTGYGQRRFVLSNTADTWTISTGSDGQQWTQTPDDSAVFNVVEPSYGSDMAIGAVTTLPATSTTTGYLVQVSAQGIPYIDFTKPLVATMDAGVSLPAMQFPLDGTVWYVDGSSGPLAIVAAPQRFNDSNVPAIYTESQQVFFCDPLAWQDVASVALRYTPIAPVFTALTDAFLIPDHARPVLIAKAEAFMAIRVSALPDVRIDPTPHIAESARAEKAYLANVSAGKRGRGLRTREVW